MLSYARDLGVESSRARPRPEAGSAVEQKPRTPSIEDDGVKLDLSVAAAQAPSSAPAPVDAPSVAPGPSDPVAPRGSAVGAYQRQGAPVLGQRVAIRA